ncbi:AraC family transcriptional regulator [Mucilaginibacter limnophilus]|uniref:AraC family transcriptional regulator n=1 Tax=Mucilaginibacter limnophilus TaxID=1932778 RepID=A0A437MTM8_9SPHI|nr:AraC family transcriptional regulator [Mucilaginibacter limnophilus]RVU01012.1 AraC family transcriptional regulator [Mucilaginibacter limnophilus]
MEEIARIETVDQYNKLRGVTTLHPLVSVIDLSAARPMPAKTYNFGLYAVYLKQTKCGELRYGRSYYDYQEGTLVFVAPGQIVGKQVVSGDREPKGWALLFHADLIKGTALSQHMHDYSFFSYDVREALHISEKEQQIVLDLFSKIAYELEQGVDKFSRTLIVNTIELFLNYSIRFYDRQFITREQANKGVIERFDILLNDYIHSGQAKELGFPSVAYCAEKLNLSANYFGDLIKRETGLSAHEHIQAKLIEAAKLRIFDAKKSVSDIAYELGFKYPQHFTRLFKQRVGQTPLEYRQLN